MFLFLASSPSVCSPEDRYFPLNTWGKLYLDIMANRPINSDRAQEKRELFVEICILLSYLLGIEIGRSVADGVGYFNTFTPKHAR